MRAVLVNARESLVEERRRLGIDSQDERWEGEWHFVNPPKSWHPLLNTEMTLVLAPLARSAELVPVGDSMGVFADFETDWRIPDQVYARQEQIVEEGVTGAALVVELYSPGDESYAKLPFYAARGITEALIVHRDRRFELYRLGPEGTYQPIDDGRCTTLGVTFTTVEGPKLRIDWDGGSADV
jgi:putative restriction endonuclease